MRNNQTLITGAVQIFSLQLAITTLLVIFLNQILIRNVNPDVMLIILLYVSSDRYAFDILKELMQLSLFVPVMMFILVRIIKQYDIDNSYLIVRHKMNNLWYRKLLRNLVIFSMTTAISTITSFILYTSYVMGEIANYTLTDLVFIVVSLTCGLCFYMLLSLIISLNKSALFMVGTQAALLAIGKILIYIIPEIASFTVISAVYINHVYIPSESSVLEVKCIEQLFLILAFDSIVITILSIIFYYVIKRSDFVRRQI